MERVAAGRLAVGCVAAALGLTVLLALLGPSALQPRLTGAGWVPFFVDAGLPGWTAIGLAAAVVVVGTAGVLLGLYGAPSLRVLRWLGVAAVLLLAFLPPIGSSDHLNYAAYGRLVTLGHDPYSVTPDRFPADPVLGAVEEWAATPSVYGPVTTGVQAFASFVGGDSVRLTVFVMALVNAAAFLAVAWMLGSRGVVLWTANPLVVYHLVAGVHADTLAIALVVAALVTRFKGVFLGLGVAAKVTVGVVALGVAWESRRNLGRLALVTATALAVSGVAYWLAGARSFDQVFNASKMVSLATPWSVVKAGLQTAVGPGSYQVWIQAGSLILFAVLAALLLRALAPLDAPRVAVALAVAWLFSAAYALPWYDGLAFALLALVPRSWLDYVMVARISLLSLAYLPARQFDQPTGSEWLVDVVRSQVVPWLLLGVVVFLLVRLPRVSAVRPLSVPSPESRSPSR